MIAKLADDGGYTLIELLLVIVILGVVMGGIVTMFAAGINAEADQNRRYQAQQDGKFALDKLRREIHAGCTIVSPATNTPSSVTVSFSSDGCVSVSRSVTYCTQSTVKTGYVLLRIAATSCAGATEKLASYLTGGNIFSYLPPNSPAGSSSLPRVHVDMTLNRSVGKPGGYRLVDDIALRNGPRSCASGVLVSC